jgi:hypothetical protein
MICPGMKKRKPKEQEGLAEMEEDGGEDAGEYEKMLKDVEDEVYAAVSSPFPANVRRSDATSPGLLRTRMYLGDSIVMVFVYRILFEHFHISPELCYS